MAIVNHLHHTPNAMNKRQFLVGVCVYESTIYLVRHTRSSLKSMEQTEKMSRGHK